MLPCTVACEREFWDSCVPYWRGDVRHCAAELAAFVGPLTGPCMRGCALPLRIGLVISEAANATVVHPGEQDDSLLALIHFGEDVPRLLRGPVLQMDAGAVTTEPPHPTHTAHVDVLLDRLAPRRVALTGTSRGCAFLQRVFIESRHPNLAGGVCLRSQLAHAQYHDGSFWTYEGVRAPTPLPRPLLFVAGARDDVVQNEQSTTEPPRSPGGRMLRLDATALAWASPSRRPRDWIRNNDEWSHLDYDHIRVVLRHGRGHDVDETDMLLAWSFLAGL